MRGLVPKFIMLICLLHINFRPFDPCERVLTETSSIPRETPYSKMAATQDALGRVARKRGIEGHGTRDSTSHRDVGIKFDLETFLLR